MMARPTKAGLDYFPLDIDFFEDEKVQFINARFGLIGEAIIIRILAKIYRNGYYLKFGEDEGLLFAKGVGDVSLHSCVKDVIHESVKRGLFDKGIFNKFETLTSKGIQKRYLEASERRKIIEWINDYSLIPVSGYKNIVIVNINGVNVNNNLQSKGESKGENGNDGKESPPPEIFESYGESVLEPLDRLREQCLNDKIYFVEHVCRQNGISENTVKSKLSEFNKFLKSISIFTKSKEDYRRYFQNWLRKQPVAVQPKKMKTI